MMEFDDTTWKHHDTFMEERINVENDALAGVWQRGEEYIFKIAAIHALYERDAEHTIKLPDWQYAVKCVESLVATHLALVTMVTKK